MAAVVSREPGNSDWVWSRRDNADIVRSMTCCRCIVQSPHQYITVKPEIFACLLFRDLKEIRENNGPQIFNIQLVLILYFHSSSAGKNAKIKGPK